ncbi:9599_t:CDS:2 [Cetraspora pellucida]|uniref:9599_t:CDS:1 n=1 Tax=Cetraspora pellucida TaxID=1433469 RepID=A0A9N9BAH5_9GLOM|nr:9599_t:CDS:2 [Cetraspora pellucida]
MDNNTDVTNNCTDYLSSRKSSLQMSIFVMEVFFLILYQIFQFNFALNAIVNQYVTQIIAIAVMNGIVSLYGFIHIVEVKRLVDETNDICTSQITNLTPNYVSLDLPFIICSLMFAAAMGYFAYKLSNELAGKIYKKIGSDVTMQDDVSRILIIIQMFFAIVQFSAQYIVNRAVPKEDKFLMKIFTLIWSITMVDWFAVLVGSVFFAASAVPYCYLGIITFIYAWKTSDTFDQGLREYVGLQFRKYHGMTVKIDSIPSFRPNSIRKPEIAVLS